MAEYTVSDFGTMIADQPRMDAYANALRRAVRPGSVVVDIGTGTGIFAMLACRYGARRVCAIEPAEVIEVARSIVAANGFDDRVEFFQAPSINCEIGEQADVIVSDLRGALPLYTNHLPSVIDARNRFLRPGGILIPQEDVLWVAVVDDEAEYRERLSPWVSGTYGFAMDAATPFVLNAWSSRMPKPEQLLTSPGRWAVLDYKSIAGPNVSGGVELTAQRAGLATGLAIWFDANLLEGIGFSNAPGSPRLIYGARSAPLEEPVEVAVGDRVTVDLRANLIEDDYVWRWNTRFQDNDGGEKASFRQSSLSAVPISSSRLARASAGYRPDLSDEGRIDYAILEGMSSNRPLATIARDLVERFPREFSSESHALGRVAQLSIRYSR